MTPISTEQWRHSGEILTLNGHRIFVIDEGDSSLPVLLLIHGFPTASWDWWKIWRTLRQHYRLLTLDMLGFGFSDKPAGHPYSIMEQADIVEALVQARQLDDFHVLAHDYGDTVAQELLARQNSGTGAGQWLSLCLLNGGLFPETHHAVFAQKLLLSPLGPLVTRLISKRKFADNLKHVFGPETPPSQHDIDGFWALINFNRGKRNFHRLIGYMPDRIKHRERWVNALQQATVPIALINGSMDPVSGAHMVDRYLELIGEPTYLARLERIGHYPQVEDAKAVSWHFLKFIERINNQ
jgi:pimeloyl-ACP methyl ester carboxylesterase